jgi:hypothetical protein
MRTAATFLLMVCLPAASFAQQAASTHVTVSGCLLSLNGAFTLLTPKGERFILKGDHDTMFRYNGKQVQITGTTKSGTKDDPAPHPAELQVSKVKKLYDVCH